LHAPGVISDHHREHQVKPRHAWHAVRRGNAAWSSPCNQFTSKKKCCDYRTRSDASVLVWRILFRSIIVVCMLLEIFQTTTVNITLNQDMHGMRLADDRCDYQTRSDASVLARVLFGVCTDWLSLLNNRSKSLVCCKSVLLHIERRVSDSSSIIWLFV
jgi:hypothetical protein